MMIEMYFFCPSRHVRIVRRVLWHHVYHVVSLIRWRGFFQVEFELRRYWKFSVVLTKYGVQNKTPSFHQVYKCAPCQSIYCLECDLFIHDVLHSCPGCSMRPGPTISSTQPSARPTQTISSTLQHSHTNGGDYAKRVK